MYHVGTDDDGVERSCELDLAFHKAFWEIAGHSILVEVAAGLRSRLSRLIYERSNAQANDLSAFSHPTLVDPIASGDVDAAQEAITRDILNGKEQIFARLDEQAD